MKKVSYIMPYRKSSDERERNLILTIQWIQNNFNNFEIVLVEFDKQPRSKAWIESLGGSYIFEYSEDIFNRSRARNIGALNAEGDILVFADSDVIMKPDEFIRCIEECADHYQAVNPFYVCFDLSDADVLSLNAGRWDQLYQKSDCMMEDITTHREDLNFAGGSLMIRKLPFFYIGGWPEEMIGWGGEDDVISYKIDRFLTKKSFPYCVFHLPHQRSVYDWYDHPEFENNCKKMNDIFALSDEALVEYCEKAKRALMDHPLSKLSGGQKDSIRGFCLPPPRSIDTLELARKENDSITAYPLILD